MKAVTEYPDRKIRNIEVIDYDGDKYATILILDDKDIDVEKAPFKADFYIEDEKTYANIKAGYIYRNNRKKNFMHETLERHFC